MKKLVAERLNYQSVPLKDIEAIVSICLNNHPELEFSVAEVSGLIAQNVTFVVRDDCGQIVACVFVSKVVMVKKKIALMHCPLASSGIRIIPTDVYAALVEQICQYASDSHFYGVVCLCKGELPEESRGTSGFNREGVFMLKKV